MNDQRLIASGQLYTHLGVVVHVEPRLVSLKTAGEMYGDLSDQTIANLQDTQGFPLVRVGRRRLVPITQANEWFEARRLVQLGAR